MVMSGLSAASKKPQCTAPGAASSRWFMLSPTSRQRPLPFLKDEESASRNQRKADQVIPGYRLLEIEEREHGKHRERDHLLHRLELRRRIHRVAKPVRRHGEAVFDEGDCPADENDAPERHSLELEMAIPGKRHEHIGADQETDRQQVRRGDVEWHGNFLFVRGLRELVWLCAAASP